MAGKIGSTKSAKCHSSKPIIISNVTTPVHPSAKQARITLSVKILNVKPSIVTQTTHPQYVIITSSIPFSICSTRCFDKEIIYWSLLVISHNQDFVFLNPLQSPHTAESNLVVRSDSPKKIVCRDLHVLYTDGLMYSSIAGRQQSCK